MTTDTENTAELDAESKLATQARIEEIAEIEEALDEKIDDIEELVLLKIPSEYIDNKGSKQFNLINNENKNFNYDLKKRWYKFELEEPIYCNTITLRSTNKNIHGLEVVAVGPFGDEKTIKISNKESGNILLNINKVISCFKINPHFRFNKIVLTSISLNGYLKSYFEKIENNVLTCNSIKLFVEEHKESFKIEIDNFSKEYKEINDKIITIKAENNLLETTKCLLVEQKNRFESENLAISNQNENIANKIISAQSSFSELCEKNDDLCKEIEICKNEEKNLRNSIKKLESNKNLFAYDIEDYVRQGNSSIKLYTFISLLPWFIIAYVAYYLFNGAVNLISIEKISILKIPIADVVISRIPFTLVAGAIVISCYEFSKIFVRKILEINSQKLRFSEIGIVAKEVSSASIDGLNLNDIDITDLRTKLKMDMLKHHLKGLSLDSFDYETKSPSLLRCYIDFLSKNSSEKPKVEPSEPEDATAKKVL